MGFPLGPLLGGSRRLDFYWRSPPRWAGACRCSTAARSSLPNLPPLPLGTSADENAQSHQPRVFATYALPLLLQAQLYASDKSARACVWVLVGTHAPHAMAWAVSRRI